MIPVTRPDVKTFKLWKSVNELRDLGKRLLRQVDEGKNLHRFEWGCEVNEFGMQNGEVNELER